MSTTSHSRSIYQLHMRPESSLGTSAASWRQLRIDGPPTFDSSTYQLIAAEVGGTRNPLDLTLPEKVQICKEDVLSFKMRVHRAAADGNVANIATLAKAAGLSVLTGSDATTTAGTPTATSIDLTADYGALGQASLIADDSGVYWPVLAAAYGSQTITASMGMPSAPSASNAVEIMNTIMARTATTYQVATDETLQFRLNTYGQWDDALGDLAFVWTGCGVASIGGFSVGKAGEYPTYDISVHGTPSDMSAVDISADAFYDSGRFPVNNPDMEFGWADANSSGAIANNSVPIEKCDVSFGIKTIPIWAQGNGGTGGISGYMSMLENPTCTITTKWIKNTDFEYKWITQLEDDNTPQYIHCLQPTRDTDQPAWGYWQPNSHIQPGGEPKVDVSGDMLKISATFVGDLSGYNSELDIDEYGSSPFYHAVSGEAA